MKIYKIFRKNFQEYRKPPPLALPHQIRRKRLYILPTGHGILFMLVLFGMLMGSVNYNNNLGFLLTFLLGSMSFVSMMHTYRNLLGLEIVSVRSFPVFAGENARFSVIVRGGKAGRTALRFQLPGGREVCRDILPEQDNDVDISIPAKKRGLLKPGLLIFSSRYPLGLFRTWAKCNFSLECPVYPRPLSGPLRMTAGKTKKARDTGENAGSGSDDFESIRAYQPGDPMQHISWKAFSKGQGLMSKKFTGLAGASVFLDWAAVDGKDTEKRLSRLCGMVLKAARLDLNYGLRLPGLTVDLGKGEGHKHKCLKALAMFGISERGQDI